MRLSTPVGNVAERAMWERWGRTYQEEGTASARAGMCLECWGTAREVNAQRGRGRAGEGEDTEASKGWTLCGLSKDLAFTQWELRSCCWVLSRGVLQPHLHFRRSTLVTVWRINCKDGSREICQGATAIIGARDDAGAERGNSGGTRGQNLTWLEGECAARRGCEKGIKEDSRILARAIERMKPLLLKLGKLLRDADQLRSLAVDLGRLLESRVEGSGQRFRL